MHVPFSCYLAIVHPFNNRCKIPPHMMASPRITTTSAGMINKNAANLWSNC